MIKERVKTSAIVLLLVNLIMLTVQLWFGGGLMREEILSFAGELPIIGGLLEDDEISIPMASLSKPRRILINDGSLWIAYYNTDVAFSPIENRTRQIIEGFLGGKAVAEKPVTVRDWQAALENVSIYVEFPIAYSPQMLCSVMGVGSGSAPGDISAIRDFIILPSTDETGVFLLVRDANNNDNAHIYQFEKSEFSFPASDLVIYTQNNSDYYEPAFSTGVEPDGVSLDPMVLFFDSLPITSRLRVVNPLVQYENSQKILSRFFNNVSTAGRYDDVNGAQIYVENYGDARIYPNGLFEYKAVGEDKGVKIAESYDSYYETVNSAISFSEELWGLVSSEPLSVLVSSDLSQEGADDLLLTMDYYQGGRPVAVKLGDSANTKALNHGIEMHIVDGRIVSYRQLFRDYAEFDHSELSGDFVSALDYFVKEFSGRRDTVINDIYIGYMDDDSEEVLSACWLAKVSGEDAAYSFYKPKEELE